MIETLIITWIEQDIDYYMDTTQTIVALFILVSTCCLIDCIWHFYKLWHDQFLDWITVKNYLITYIILIAANIGNIICEIVISNRPHLVGDNLIAFSMTNIVAIICILATIFTTHALHVTKHAKFDQKRS